MSVTIINADCRSALRDMAADSVHCCLTSPPYFGLRDYDVDGQIGLEPTPDEFVAVMVEVFRDVRRVLRPDGTLWLNLGDSFANDGKWGGHTGGKHAKALHASPIGRNKKYTGLKPKDLIGIPWRVALALQTDGWWWRQWLPWVKRNPMPESTKDRPTSACEVWLMFTRSEAYFYDYEAVKAMRTSDEDANGFRGGAYTGGRTDNAEMGRRQTVGNKRVSSAGKKQGEIVAAAAGASSGRRMAGFNDRWDAAERKRGVPPRHAAYPSSDQSGLDGVERGKRAFRNSDLFFESIADPHGAVIAGEEIVALDVATKPFRGAHYATFPPDLIAPLIKASCPHGGTVLDPFGGSGTVGVVCERLGRDAVLIELNPDNAEMARQRIIAETSPSAIDRAKAKAAYISAADAPLFASIEGSAA